MSETATELDSSDPPLKDTPGLRQRKKHLYQQIMNLMEFYLSDSNLRKDRYFNQLLQENPEIDISVFLKCNKLARLTSNPEDVVKALKKSTLLQVTKDGTKVRRTEELQDKPDVDECMIYVEKLPPDAEHEYIEKVFSKYGKVTYVSLPKFKATGKLKGFAFVEFATKEEANRALEAYTEMGCRLPSTMSPESLVSIQTFEGEKSNLTMQQENRFLAHSPQTKSRQQSDASHREEKSINRSKEKSNSTAEDKSSNRYKEKSSLSEEKSIDKIEEGKKSEDNSPPSKKARIEGVESSDAEEKASDANDDTNQDTSVTTESSGKKKKKSRKKKKKSNNEANPDDTGLQVLSKIEWKKLRNQYLNLQRTKMRKLKTHLQSIKRSQWSHPNRGEGQKKDTTATKEQSGDGKTDDGKDFKYGIEFVAGTIVRVHLDEPLVDVKLFKNELKHKPNVKYVDATVGSQEVFVRCVDPGEAEKMIESKCFPHCDILKGEEEVLYWEKIEYDRRVKFSTKPKPCRGRDKLLKKAEKALGKHIRFDNVAEEAQ